MALVTTSERLVRGRIDRIEIDNFKSYAGKQTIGPFLDFTAIIGPNGAGKSNLMDAISFVVGLQSKDLRGKQLKDLVFKSSADEDISGRGASVSLVCELENDETRFTRSISAAGVGEYRLNGKAVKWEAYAEKLKSFNILTKAHTGFLVFQGYVSELAAKSPKELSALFEQISGSEELKEEYEKLEAEKKQAEEEQIYNHQKKKGLAQEKAIMKKQKEEAEAYQRLEDRKQQLQKLQYLQRLYVTEREIVKLREELRAENEALGGVAEAHANAEASMRLVEKDKARLTRKAVELERSLSALQQQVEGQNPAAIKLREEIKHIERRRAAQAKSLEKTEETYSANSKQIKALERQLAEISEALASAMNEQKEAEERGELEMGKRQRDEYNRLKAEAGAKTAALHEVIHAKTREIKSDEPIIMQGRTRLDEYATQRAALESKLSALSDRKHAVDARIEQLEVELSQLASQLEQAESAGTRTRVRQGELREELSKLAAALSSSKAEQRETERERKSAEALENLKRLIPGVHGRMIDICKPTQRRYNAAVTIAMGKSMEAIVVEEESVAIECIKYLKAQKCAPETFVPLDSIRAKPVAERLRRLGGSKRPVFDVISVSEKFVRAVQYAVADTVLCDTLNEARQLAYHSGEERFKVVTLDGTLINKAGLMTGGSSPQDRARANRWDEKSHVTLKAQAEATQRELASLSTVHASEEAITALRHKFEQISGELESARSDAQLTASKEAKVKQDLKDLDAATKDAQTEVRVLEKKRDAQKREVDKLTTKCNAVEDDVFADFSRSFGISSVREYEQKQLVEAQEKEKRILELQAQESKLRSCLQFEQRKDLPRVIEKLRVAVAEDEASLRAKKAEQAKADAAADALKQKANQLENEVKAAKDAQDVKAAEVKKLKKELKQVVDEMSKHKARAAQLEHDIHQQRSQRQRVFQRARLEEVALPVLAADAEPETREGGGSKRKRGKERATAGPSSEAIAELMASESFSPTGLVGTGTLEGESAPPEPTGAEAEEDAVRIDFSFLHGEEATSLPDNEAATTDELLRVVSEIEGMTPNMKALEQFEEVQARMHAMEGEWEGSRTTARTVSQRFSAVQAQRHERYMAAFTHVSRVIDSIYKDLTQVEGVPLGGTAFLSLEDPHEPYLHGIKYTAMPPAKRFRDMEQLSGGERTVAALALLFAIHDYRPSPFFVMDEIDAALDNVNVTRVAQYIRERADEGSLQFVVISLKDNFYERANGLVGIYRDRAIHGSNTITLDLDKVEALNAEDAAAA
mmetsp:Transcript_13773/g.37285  ORF Transcript_13773/g.37285 Transcript_13773/m.37285 type:complete len:1277 (-) Transcript_13773:524-4354(-)